MTNKKNKEEQVIEEGDVGEMPAEILDGSVRVVDSEGNPLPNVIPVEDYEVDENGDVERLATRTAGSRFANTMKDDELAPVDYFISIGHPMSPKVISGERAAGLFYIDEHPGQDVIHIMVLGVATRRTYWDPSKRPPNGEVLCKSMDGIRGVGNPGGFCRECRFIIPGSSTNPAASENAVACPESRVFEVFVKEWNKVCLWEMKGRAMGLARKIKTLEANDGPFGSWILRVRTELKVVKGDQVWDLISTKLDEVLELPEMALTQTAPARPRLPF